MRLACLSSREPRPHVRRKPRAPQFKPCRWIAKSNGFLAQRPHEFKFFDAGEDIDEARHLASRWAKGGDRPSSDDEGECMGVTVYDTPGVIVNRGSMSTAGTEKTVSTESDSSDLPDL